MRTEATVRTKLSEKKKLLRNVRESLSSDMEEKAVNEHPAVLAQEYYVRALEWVLEEIDVL
jgi:hypothetical protein